MNRQEHRTKDSKTKITNFKTIPGAALEEFDRNGYTNFKERWGSIGGSSGRDPDKDFSNTKSGKNVKLLQKYYKNNKNEHK